MDDALPRRIARFAALLLLASATFVSAVPFVYVAGAPAFNTVSVIDAATNTVMATIVVSSTPVTVAINPSGTRAYVASTSGQSVAVIDTATNTVLATIPMPGPALGVSTDGARVYVATPSVDAIQVIDAATNTPIGTLSLGAGTAPRTTAIDTTLGKLFIANNTAHNVSVADTATLTLGGPINVGNGPYGTAVDSVRSRLFVANQTDSTVSVVNTSTNAVVATVPTGVSPVLVSADEVNGRAYVANTSSGTVTVIDTNSATVAATIPVGGGPFGTAVDPAHGRAYASNQLAGTVSVIDTATATVVATIVVGGNPRGMAVTPTFPRVTSVAVPPNATYRTGQVLDFVVNWDNPVTVTGTPRLGLTIGAAAVNASYLAGSGTSALTFRYTVQAGDLDGDGIAIGALSLNGGTIRLAGRDANLTLNAVASTAAVLVDAVAPTISTVAVPANGNYLTSQILDFAVNFSEGVTVDTTGGTPSLPLTIGAAGTAATYVSGSGTGTLVFRHLVTAGENDNDGIAVGAALALNGATIRDAAANDATLALGGVAATAGVLVNQAFVVTPSANAGGTLTPNTPVSVASGATAAFTVAPNPGFTASVGGTCGGLLSGTTYTTNPVTTSCTVVATFTALAVTTFSGPSATGTGTITAAFTGGGAACTFAVAQFIPVTGHAASPPAGTAPVGVAFPHGLFDFRTTGCTPGSTLSFTITYPAALPAGASYYKYGPTAGSPAPHWYVLPATLAGNTASFAITDGGLGDDDLAANGTVVDQGGPGLGSGVQPVPTLSEWAMLLIATLLLLMGAAELGRRGPAVKPRR